MCVCVCVCVCYLCLEMSTENIPKSTSESFVLPKHALAILR